MPFAAVVAVTPSPPEPLPAPQGSMAALDVATVTADSPPDQQIAKAVQGGLEVMPPAVDPVVDPGKPVRDYWDEVWASTTPGTHLWEVARSVMYELSVMNRWDAVVYAAWCEAQRTRTPDQITLYPNP